MSQISLEPLRSVPRTSLSLGIGVLAAIAALSLVTVPQYTGMASAADNTTDTNVTVSVEGQTIVSVDPAAYNFSGMSIGETNFSQSNPGLQLVVSNDGSNNITEVYAHPDTHLSEDDNPLGTGKARQYAAGRFLWVQNATSDWYHAGTQTWNITDSAGGWPAGIENGNDNNVSYGFYRNASNGDYLWELAANATDTGQDGTSGGPGSRTGNWQVCNSSTTDAPEFTIKDNPDTGSNRDIGDAGTTTSYTLDAARGANWSVRKATSGPLNGHYVASYKDCSRVYIYRFDADNMFPNAPSGDNYLVSSNAEIAPGEEYTGRVGAAVHEGVPAGETNLTVLTIGANAAS
jgi:hypothetical protein